MKAGSKSGDAGAGKGPRRRPLLWVLGFLVVALVGFAGYLIAPFFLPSTTGSSGQGFVTEGFPLEVSATGDDGRSRTLSVAREDGGAPDLSALVEGERLIVSGEGFNPASGIYVAICQVPDALDVKPGPCLGGVPELDDTSPREQGSVDWAASNWINNDWAWKLFGARGFDDMERGSFTAYLVVPPGKDETADCLENPCGLYTRNDHTDLDNRVQDLYLPVSFGE